MKRLSTFVIAVALIAGMVSYGGGGVEYDLSITSTAGGSVPLLERGFYLLRKRGGQLMAAKDAGYRSVNCTGDVDDIANVEDATTTITMNGDYSVTAEFVKPKQSLEIAMRDLP